MILLIFPFACSNKNEVPERILPRKKMQEVMWDMVRAGEFLNSFVFYRDSSIDKTAESQKWIGKICHIHKISKADFDRSYAYYQDHPLLMKALLDSLSKKQVPYRLPGQGSATVKDSIKNKIAPPASDTQKKIIDTLRKRKILKKRKYKVV